MTVITPERARETLRVASVAGRVRHYVRQGAEADDDAIRQHLQMIRPRLEVIQRQARRLELARMRGWTGAIRRSLAQLQHQQSNVQYELELLGNVLRRPGRTVPQLREVVDELKQLADELGDWQYDRRNDTLRVETEPIELEGLYLGPFAIELSLGALSRSDPQAALIAIALEPHPAAGSEGVTHPHVSDERICLGEATAPVRTALKAGRLADALLLVRSVLHHYNADSPYVAIEDWQAEPCEDCGASMDEDNRHFCDVCERNYCSDCIGRCTGCDSPVCLGCLGMCDRCGEPFCRDCQRDGICESCFEEMENEDDEQDEETESEGAPQCEGQESASGQAGAESRPAGPASASQAFGVGERGAAGDADAPVHAVRVGEAELPVSPR